MIENELNFEFTARDRCAALDTEDPQYDGLTAVFAQRQNYNAIRTLDGARPSVNAVIRDGSLPLLGGSRILVDTEGQAPADDLVTIPYRGTDERGASISLCPDGAFIFLKAKDASRTITVKHSQNESGIRNVGGLDVKLSADAWYKLRLEDGHWVGVQETLPATTTTLGVVRVGQNLTITPDGVLSTSGVDANSVHKTGADTIGGEKTFTTNPITANTAPGVTLRQENIVRGINPSTELSCGDISLTDKNGRAVSKIYNRVTAVGQNETGVYVYNFVNPNANDPTSIRVGILPNGTTYTYAPTPSASARDNNIATTAWVADLLLPPGAVMYFATATAPKGFIVCDGSPISRSTYSALFNAVGVIYGAGNGSSTFNLPNLIGRFIEGSTAVGSYINAGLPDLTGAIWNIQYHGGLASNGVFTGSYHLGSIGNENDGPDYNMYWCNIQFNAHNSNSIYGSSATVQPPALTLLPCIKY